ncbi:hypothetical protein AAII07_52480 [Microvirga sp. 0TCS3.31]
MGVDVCLHFAGLSGNRPGRAIGKSNAARNAIVSGSAVLVFRDDRWHARNDACRPFRFERGRKRTTDTDQAGRVFRVIETRQGAEVSGFDVRRQSLGLQPLDKLFLPDDRDDPRECKSSPQADQAPKLRSVPLPDRLVEDLHDAADDLSIRNYGLDYQMDCDGNLEVDVSFTTEADMMLFKIRVS